MMTPTESLTCSQAVHLWTLDFATLFCPSGIEDSEHSLTYRHIWYYYDIFSILSGGELMLLCRIDIFWNRHCRHFHHSFDSKRWAAPRASMSMSCKSDIDLESMASLMSLGAWRTMKKPFVELPWDDVQVGRLNTQSIPPAAFRATPCPYLQHQWTVQRTSSTTVRSNLAQLRISCIRSCNIAIFYTRKILKVSFYIFFTDPELRLKFWRDPWEMTDNDDTTLTRLLCPVQLERMA